MAGTAHYEAGPCSGSHEVGDREGRPATLSVKLDLSIDLQWAGEAGSGTLSELELPTAPERIADRLVTAIALGEYVAGQRLPSERELATLLGVGRATVREALHRIAALGYVEISRGRHGGAFVTADWRPSSAGIIRRTLVAEWPAFEHLLDLRRLIEPLAASTAAARHDQDDERRLRAAQAAYRNAPDREASRIADSAIHSAVADATHNGYLAALSLQIRSKVTLGFPAEPYSSTIREQAVVTHDALVEAILRCDEQDAAAAMAANIALTEEAIRGLVHRAEAFVPDSKPRDQEET
jgi:GntR family transcriptional repressor for pyruvate dehydrogenase complex